MEKIENNAYTSLSESEKRKILMGTRGYVRPDTLEKKKQDYLENLDRENETVWGEPIEFVTVDYPIYNRTTNSFDSTKTLNAIKLGHLYFFVKDELTPEYSYTAEEIKDFLLDGDIGVWVTKPRVKQGYFMDYAGGMDEPLNFHEQLFADIGSTPWQAPYHDWQIWA